MPKEAFGPDHPFMAGSRLMTRAEIGRIVRVFVGAGVEKVRLTGGEPLLRSDLPAIIREIKHGIGVPDTLVREVQSAAERREGDGEGCG